ncbi:AAA-ATPase-like protein [Candidatus Vecturithrix granuli]|uniref:AAA-ATPase-like protein n=1 Tax=Vecturithrix granuli TaxID=1499967 RepID=A0A081C4K1_VECG1|nr:AAA-ATPase-like protein [Candidatus Vecturithrix granuli]
MYKVATTSQGKTTFKDLVRTDGYVRPFYEALKKETKTVVDRIFITGELPVLLNSLTSGFNIGMNLSTEEQFNEMFGFTEEEITPILDGFGEQVSREEIRTYYNGYRFSPNADQSVYNSDMILHYASEYQSKPAGTANMLDPNVVSDYRKIRAILSIGDPEVEERILTQMVQQEYLVVNEITPLLWNICSCSAAR